MSSFAGGLARVEAGARSPAAGEPLAIVAEDALALIDQDECEKARRLAANHWRGKGEAEIAARFDTLEISACGFGMDSNARLVFSRARGPRVGLRFDIEKGT